MRVRTKLSWPHGKSFSKLATWRNLALGASTICTFKKERPNQSMEIKIHSERFKTDHHWASVIPYRIISFKVGSHRLFFHHSIAVDRRGTHYGDTCECLGLIKNPREYRRLRKQFVRRGTIGDDVIKALTASHSKCLYRGGGLESPVEQNRWNESVRGRCHPLEYWGFSSSFS